MCEEKGWDLLEIVVEAESGGKKNREKVDAIFADLSRFDILLVDKPNRFTRRFSTSVLYKERLEEAGGEIWSREPRMNMSEGVGAFMWQILSSAAEHERREISMRVSDVSKDQRAAGEHNGKAPYGYERPINDEGKRKGVIVAHPFESLIVVRIFTEYSEGRSGHEIAKDLAREGVPAREGEWHQGTVSAILSNPIHKGYVRRKVEGAEELFPGKHAPLVTEQLWDACADRRARLTRTTSNGGGRKPNGDFLFTKGTLRCTCGGALVPRTNSKQKVPSYRYFCLTRRKDRDACDQEPIPRELIDGPAWSYFERIGLDLEATRADLTAAHDAKVAELRGHVDAAERERQEAAVRLDRIKGYFQDGDLTPAEWREQREELEPALAAADAQVAQHRDQLERVELGDHLFDAEGAMLRALAGIRAAVAGSVSGAKDVLAAREAIARVFAEFRLMPAPHVGGDAEVAVGADLCLMPVPRPDAIASPHQVDEDGRIHAMLPFEFKRTPLAMPETTDKVGFWT